MNTKEQANACFLDFLEITFYIDLFTSSSSAKPVFIIDYA